MLRDFINDISIVHVGILLTLGYILYRFKRETNRYLLLLVLLLFVCTEILTKILVKNDLNHNPVYNISLIIHSLLWFRILFINSNKRHLFFLVSSLFLVFALVDMFYIEGWEQFNAYSLLAGALIYLSFFVVINIQQFNRENFDFLSSNENMLLYTPLFLFISISVYTGFHDSELGDVEIIPGFPLYYIINTFGNLLYYGFINLYVYRVNKLEYA